MLITFTGWTWQYIDEHVTLPQVYALNVTWRVFPPAALMLKRIGQALGMKFDAAAAPRAGTAEEAVREAMAAGLPVFEGLPDDPLVAFLDLPEKAT